MKCSHCADLVGLLGESYPRIHRDLLRDRHDLGDPVDTNRNLVLCFRRTVVYCSDFQSVGLTVVCVWIELGWPANFVNK